MFGTKNKKMQVVVPASILILLMYFLSGVHKLQNFEGTVLSLAERAGSFVRLHMAVYQVAIAAVIALLLLAPPVIVYSAHTQRHKEVSSKLALALAAFTVLATLLYHFPPRGKEHHFFMKNLTAIGALLLLAQQ